MFVKTSILTVLVLPVTGCASTQLNFNTVDIAGSVSNLYTRQVLNNLSTFASNPQSLPSQIDIQSGTVQTSNAITPNLSFPLTSSTTNGIAGLVGSRSNSFAAATAGVSGADNWQQNWNITPLTDANTLRNLKALYRYAVYGTDLKTEYHVPRLKEGQVFKPDPFLLAEPQCVLCGPKREVNRQLSTGAWLYWQSDAGATFSHMPPNEKELIDLGHFGDNELFMTRTDYVSGVLSDFVLFVLPITEPASGDSSKAGSAPGARVGASANRPNFAPVPLGIQP